MEKIEFQKKLAALGVLAQERGGRLTMREVQTFFAEMPLTEEQFELIYAYLASQHVTVEGYAAAAAAGENSEEKQEIPLTPEEEQFLVNYEEELAARDPQMEQLFRGVIPIAREFCGRGTFLGDLVQEGNIGLLLALESLESHPQDRSVPEYLEREIRRAISQATQENESEKQAGNQLADRLNHLSDSIKELSDELDRKISVEELSVYMDMLMEEIEDLLKLAGESQDGAGEKE